MHQKRSQDLKRKIDKYGFTQVVDNFVASSTNAMKATTTTVPAMEALCIKKSGNETDTAIRAFKIGGPRSTANKATNATAAVKVISGE
jgi:hypothetical protein